MPKANPSLVASVHLRQAAGVPDIRDVMDSLRNLSELDENLDEFEYSFNSKFAASKKLNPEVSDQHEALSKALKGLKAAEETKKQAQTIVELFPEDKTAPRAVAAAEVMIKRFDRHAEAARKIIRRIAKKEMPADLKKAYASLSRALKRRLEDSSALQVIPWASGSSWQGTLAIYEVYLVVQVDNQKKGILLRQDLYAPGARHRKDGVQFGTVTMGGHSYVNTPYKLSDAVDAFTEYLRGWPGLQGEADATAKRQQVASEIAGVVRSYSNRMTVYSRVDRTKIQNNGLSVSGGFRRNTRWEDHADWDYEREVPVEGAKYEADLKSRLKPWAKHIRDIQVSYSEKGWWSIWIQLK